MKKARSNGLARDLTTLMDSSAPTVTERHPPSVEDRSIELEEEDRGKESRLYSKEKP